MQIRIAGFDRSLSDWPGRPCVVVFTQGCNLRCPWCQNVHTIDPAGGIEVETDSLAQELASFLPLIDAVMLSGGEPLLQVEACIELARACKEKTLKVGLETNGTLPHALERILPLLDFVAIDVKAPLRDEILYRRVTGSGFEGMTQSVRNSLELTSKSGVEWEARLTLVPTLTAREEIVMRWAKDLRGLAKNVCLLQFRNLSTLDPSFQKLESPSREFIKWVGSRLENFESVRIYTREGGFEELKSPKKPSAFK
jgi:pyruvate formate lyase activating enzyme